LEIVALIANGIPHLVEIKQEILPDHVNLQSTFIDLCDSSDEDRMLPNFLCPLKSLLHMNHFASISIDSPYSIRHIPSMGTPFVLSVVNCLRVMFATHASFELRELNYDKFWIENVRCIPTTFDGDVLSKLPPMVNRDS
jgi:hypothetical protein